MSHREPRSSVFFEDTQWGTILKAQRGDHEALERLLTRYRRPMMNEIRARRRTTGEDAEDLAQEFVLLWFKRDLLRNVAAEKGRFRSYLKRCLSNFLADQHASAVAVKRGGGMPLVSLDEQDEASQPLLEPATPAPAPGLAFDVEWAFTVLDGALERLRAECASDAAQLCSTRWRVTSGMRPRPLHQWTSPCVSA